MSERRPGCLPFMFLQGLGLLQLAVILAVWLPMALTHHRFGAAPAIAVALVCGAAGWWVSFRLREPWQERFLERCYGRKEDAESWAARMAWGQLQPSMKIWARVVYAFVVIAPIVQILCRQP